MNRYVYRERCSACQVEHLIWGTLIVRVLDRDSELPVANVYAGMSDYSPDEASITYHSTRVAVTDDDGCFSYQLPSGRWYLALSKNNWHEVWVPADAMFEITIVHNSG